MRIAAYCRVSTDTADQLNSLETQKQFFAEYTEKNGHNLVKLYADEGISGTKIKNRKQFQQLLKDAEKGLFEMIVVKDISRFARNTVDFLQSIRTLKALGIETTFLTANMGVLGNSEFMLTIFGAMAQEESANTSKRIKFGKKMNAEKGRVPNLVYGYDKVKGEYFSLNINKQEAQIIREIFDLYLRGYGAARIAVMLNDRGVVTKRGFAWSQNAICRILTNELYTGKIVNGKQEIIDFLTGARTQKSEDEWLVTEKPELRIVDDATFERAGGTMAERGQLFKSDKERHSSQHLFSTLIKCKDCGYSFRRTVRQYKNTYVRWVCSGRNGKGVSACPNAISFDEDELIKHLDEYFAESVRNKKDLTKSLVKEFKRVYKDKDENESYEQKLMDELSALKKLRQKHIDMYKDDIITRKEMNDAISGIASKIAKLENALATVEYNLSRGDQLETLNTKTFDKIGRAHV